MSIGKRIQETISLGWDSLLDELKEKGQMEISVPVTLKILMKQDIVAKDRKLYIEVDTKSWIE